MKCPFCDETGTRPELHAHMVRSHKDRLQTRHDEDRMFFDVNCPLCSEGMTREVNPRGRDQAFLDKFAEEIRMVGYDLLLYHWETHEESHSPVDSEVMQ
jgi:hypothetical protein